MQATQEHLAERTAGQQFDPLRELQRLGQSVWLDYIRRQFILDGELQQLIDDGLRGLTSNPSIFEKALAAGADYDEPLARAGRQRDRSAMELYEEFAVSDIRTAADRFRPVYEATRRGDGYVCLEVSPYLAHDTQKTIAEARRLWKEIGRENVMIKVPATEEGIPAIRQLLGEGINVNVTLLFAREMYERVADVYLDGLESWRERGGEVSRLAGVASFFVSRIDTAADAKLNERLKIVSKEEKRNRIKRLFGRVAMANAKMAYQSFRDIFRGPRWESLARSGARVQRLLWASTSTKNPQYRDVLYVEELIGRDTVNTMPPDTLEAFRDHGRVRPSLEEHVEEAHRTIEAMAECGVSLRQITDSLLDDGVRRFAESFDQLLAAVEKKRAAVQTSSHAK